MTMLPARSDPDRMWAWGCFPMSIPAMIPSDPDMIGAWANTAMFHDRSRWCDSHYDFGGLHGSDAKAEA
jgi:hypothetical protein